MMAMTQLLSFHHEGLSLQLYALHCASLVPRPTPFFLQFALTINYTDAEER